VTNSLSSRMSIAKHPIHPMLVSFPIAFLTVTVLTDLGFWQTGDLFWARVSFWLLGAGVFLGILSAIAGVVDFFAVDQVQAHGAGWVHFTANIFALTISALNFTLRLERLEGYILFFGLILSAITAFLLVIGGWSGGELTFRHRVGSFDRPGDNI